MKVKLKDLTDIQTGYPFRGAIVAGSSTEGLAVIQMGDLAENLVPDLKNVIRSGSVSVKAGHVLKSGDILFRARGNFPAGYWLKELPERMIAAAPLQRIRIRTNALLPGFLAWYLRQSAALSYFEANSQGSSLRMVGIDVLENLMIPVIPLEKQQKIIELVELSERERELAQKLIALKSVYINKTVNQWLGE